MFTAQQYVKAASLEEAYELNQKKNNVILGGGCWLKMNRKNYHTVIDLSGLGLDTIEETPEEVVLGAMVTLRQMETSSLLKEYFGTGFLDMTRHIVGVQFRNCATLGGSLASRFGFSDILTWLMGLGAQVELFHGGRVSVEEYAAIPYDRDILVRVYLPKDGRKAVYESVRNTQTDIPVLACSVCLSGGMLRAAIGARPGKAMMVPGEYPLSQEGIEQLIQAAQKLEYGTNMRASAQYRRHLAQVLVRRACGRIQEV
ncbi:MAG: FAD binding domain-containing protein [Massiliimalia sp.]|jgi:putative selenate reductase FAD-binding subunit